VTEDTIVERIEDAAEETPFVIVDLEGTASMIVLYAISQADFIVIPTQGSQLDRNEASRRIPRRASEREIDGQSKTVCRASERATHPSIRARGLAHIQNGLIDAGIPVLQTELNERDAFKAVFSFRQTLEGNAAEVPKFDKAKLNVLRLSRKYSERRSGGGR